MRRLLRILIRAVGLLALIVAICVVYEHMRPRLARLSLLARGRIDTWGVGDRPELRRVAPPDSGLIAHAGGGIEGRRYTNTRTALDRSFAAGFRWFELDFSWTTDHRLVLVHDWDLRMEELFHKQPGERTHDDFMRLTMVDGLRQMDVADLADWLDSHADGYVVTDVKDDNVAALTLMVRDHPSLRPHLLPQIYSFDQYPAAAIGPNAPILTLYAKPYDDSAVLRFAAHHTLTGVTMPGDRAQGPLPHALRELGVTVFAHTVNDPDDARRLRARGVVGLYTDFLVPGSDR